MDLQPGINTGFSFISEELLPWYEKNKRVLPFREKKDAYGIWVSEIMAQQTRIEAMLGYYERFMKELPTMKDLAQCDDQKLHKLWQGLGYYSRVKNMKKCAQICMERYEGRLPNTKDELMKLPGIGAYTAGAIASIAYDQRVTAVDGNVIRVFSRLFHIQDDMAKTTSKKALEKLVEASLPESSQISDYNQALMELGALICIPQSPRCDQCPLCSFCQAFQQKDMDKLPIFTKKIHRKKVKKVVYIHVWKDHIHVQKRKETGLLAGLYGFDEALCSSDKILDMEPLKPYTHIFSHVEWEMEAFLVRVKETNENFYSLDHILKEIPIPSAFQPFLKEVEEKIRGD